MINQSVYDTEKNQESQEGILPENIKKKLYIYDPYVYEHYNNPKNVGKLNEKDPDVGTGLVGSPSCGDVMKLQIKFDHKGNVADVKFQTFGCTAVIASSSAMTELIKEKNLQQLMDATNEKNKQKGQKGLNAIINDQLKLPPIKYHCSMLGEEAIRAALKDYQEKTKRKNKIRYQKSIRNLRKKRKLLFQ
jgi:NifU-like protein involved in Fe-S cluster formation